MDDKKQFICDESKFISKNEAKEIIKIIGKYSIDKIKEFCDGTRTDLKQLDESVINEIYNYMKSKCKPQKEKE